MTEALHWLPAWQLEAMVVKREISPVELTEHFLDRLDRLEPTLHSMITVADDHAREAARVYEDAVPDEDSTVCARARAAGAILVGKTNTPEFGMYGRAINLVSEESVNP